MVFNAQQLTSFFQNAPQMALTVDQRNRLAQEGLATIDDFVDFKEDQLIDAFKNMRIAIPGVPAVLDDQGNIVGVGDFDAQVEQSINNLSRLLKLGGSDLSKIVKVVIYVTEMSNFPKVLELRERYFTSPYPADTLVEVSALGLPELEFEIEAIALVDGEIVG